MAGSTGPGRRRRRRIWEAGEQRRPSAVPASQKRGGEDSAAGLRVTDATSRGRGSASSAGFGGIQSTHVSTVYSVPGRTQPTSLFIQTRVHLGPTRFNSVKPPIQTLPNSQSKKNGKIRLWNKCRNTKNPLKLWLYL